MDALGYVLPCLNMLAYRILHKKYGDPLFAPGLPGRWNSAGNKVLYTSESIALAFLESMVRRQGVGFNSDFNIACFKIPDELPVSELLIKQLSKGWNDPFDYSKSQPAADTWFKTAKTMILKVPSVALNICFNYVLNTLHPDFKQIELLEVTGMVPDPRIEQLLKR